MLHSLSYTNHHLTSNTTSLSLSVNLVHCKCHITSPHLTSDLHLHKINIRKVFQCKCACHQGILTSSTGMVYSVATCLHSSSYKHAYCQKSCCYTFFFCWNCGKGWITQFLLHSLHLQECLHYTNISSP